ncbi:unnamed protein product [Rhizophagus irregularis]|nr:unnamed protein product [Rhizophagus irregularis]CAB5352232.1 unnamed protein product [Rhizophagus irregularis]
MLSKKFRISNRRLYRIWRETKNYSMNSVIDGKEKKKKTRTNSLREPSSDAKHISEPNIQGKQIRAVNPLGISDDKNISLNAKFEKLQKGFEEIKRNK